MRKVLITITFIFSSWFFAHSQGRAEWFQFAEEAFQNEDYPTAAVLYQNVLESANGNSRNIAYPYAMKYYFKKNDSDSLKNSSVAKLQTNQDSNMGAKSNKEGNNLIVEIKEDYVFHQIAESYQLSYDYEKAEAWYKRSVQNNSPEFPAERYGYAISLMKNKKYELAIKQIDTLKMSLGKDNPMIKAANKIVTNCQFALNKKNQKQDLVQELDSTINFGFTSFAANFYEKSSLVFSSSKIPAPSKRNESTNKNDNLSLDIYTATKSGSDWSKITPMPETVNSEEHDLAGTFSADGTKFYFTRTNPKNKKECAIYLSRFLNDTWLKPFKLNGNVNREGYRSMQPTLSADGTRLYFVSDMPGGQGKLDIWYTTINEKGNASRPVNMGKRVNSPEDETSPFFHVTSNTLFYSSEGFTGFGGLDVFKSKLNTDDSTWSAPKNLGAPINSSREDAYFVLDKDQKTGFVSSDRKICKDCSAGSCYKVYSVIKEPNKFILKGVTYNSETNDPLPNALLTFKDVHGDTPNFFVVSDSSGAYSRDLSDNIELFIKAQKNKFFADANAVSTLELTESTILEKDFFLSPIPQGDIVIPGIEYDYDKATLRPSSIKVLEDLVEFLNLNDNISVQISSHCDERGTDEYNMELSIARATSVVNFLLSKGIAEDRLLAQGYGKTRPLIPFDEIEKMATEEEKEAAHQRNRRTAFMPIKEDEIRSK